MMVIKRGSHFPYEMNYPGGAIAQHATRADKYSAAVSYTTGRFFDVLSSGIHRPDLLFIYTSDHGEDLESRSTHCNPHPDPAEFSVPLVVLTDAAPLKDFLAQGLDTMRGRASHLNIFPTLLYAMGYRREWIEETYGPTLSGPPAAYLTLAWHLPYPTKRKAIVDYEHSATFPKRQRAAGIN